LQRDGRLVDGLVQRNIELSRDTDARNAEVKRRLCAALHLECAALADEGFVVYSPERRLLQAALDGAVADAAVADTTVAHQDAEPASRPWRFVSNRSETVDSLSARGAVSALAIAGGNPSFEYIGFRPPSTPPMGAPTGA
jgi:hypothetical protein